MTPTTLPAGLPALLEGALAETITGDPGRPTPVVEVFTGRPLTTVPTAGEDDVERAFATAREAQRAWASTSVFDRMKVFARFHRAVLDHQDTLVDLIQAETGKARRSAFEELCDIPMVLSHYLTRAPRILHPKRGPGAFPLISESVVYRRPLGVVGVLAPWNFPFAIGFCDAIPALMAGNAVVLKPDHRTPLSPAFGLRLLREAGLPEGLMQIVCGDGPALGQAIVDRADFAMFTGSTTTGRRVAARAGERLIGSCLELGGKNPMLVLPDADLDAAAEQLLSGTFHNTGQLCLHIERVLVHDSVYEAFRSRLLAAVASMVVAPGYRYGIDMGGLANPEQLARVAAQVDDAREAGATVLVGGRARPDLGPTFYEPTVLEGVTPEMAIADEETFGPVLSLSRYTDVEEAVAAANASRYGLNASVWGRDRRRAQAVAARLEAGSVNVNDCLALAYATKDAPSGGFKDSGVGVRNGDGGLLKFTQPTHVATQKRALPNARTEREYLRQVTQSVRMFRLLRRFRIR